MVEKILNQLTSCSDEELELVSKKVQTIWSNRRYEKIEKLKENFIKAWKDLEKMGVDIYSKDEELILLDDITFDEY